MIEFQCLAYGVEQHQEGICLLISVGAHRILLDCGLKDMFPLLLDLHRTSEQNGHQRPLDAIFCSHAHTDHTQGLFQLQSSYPEVPIYLSRATAKLLEFQDYYDNSSAPFKHSLQPLEWRSAIAINDELTLELLPVGHLPGAAACLLSYHSNEDNSTQTLLYTGDICLSNSRLTDGLPLQSYRNLSPDILIMEGTFGVEKLPNRRQQENHLIQTIKTGLETGSNIAIQVEPLGQAQELLLLFKSHPIFANQPIQIWIDSSIKQACDLTLEIINELPNRVQNFAKTQTLFLENKLSPQIKEFDVDIFKNTIDTPTILLFSEKNQQKIKEIFCNQVWTFFLTNRKSELLSKLPYEAPVNALKLDNHPDGQGLLQLIHNLKPQHVAFCHGSPTALAELCCLEELSSRYHLHLPQTGHPLEILVGPNRLISQAPSLTEMMFEGELNENNREVKITLPTDVTLDNRWEAIADSGIILATWQGENLVIQGISQRELLSNQNKKKQRLTSTTCSQCKFYRGIRCINPTSAMHQRNVAPDGYCQEHQPKLDEPPQ